MTSGSGWKTFSIAANVEGKGRCSHPFLGSDGNMLSMPAAEDPSGFFVEWQLADDDAVGPGRVIDLSAEGSDVEVVLSDDADARIGPGA